MVNAVNTDAGNCSTCDKERVCKYSEGFKNMLHNARKLMAGYPHGEFNIHVKCSSYGRNVSTLFRHGVSTRGGDDLV